MPRVATTRGSHPPARQVRRWRTVLALLAIGLQTLISPAQSPLPAPSNKTVMPDIVPTPAPVMGQQAGIDPELYAKLKKPGNLTLKASTLADALFSISETWKINLVVGQEVTGQVNGVFKNAPLSEILDSILLSNGFSYRPVGQSLVIMPLKDLGDINPLFETVTIPVLNSKPEDLISAVKMLSSPQGKLQAITSAKSLLVTDFPDRVALIRNFVIKIDEATASAIGDGGPGTEKGRIQAVYLSPQYVTAAALKESLNALLSKEGKVAVMEGDNRVVVADYPAQLRLAEQAFEQLDHPRPQVRITALIYDLALEDSEQLGLNWKNAFKGRYDSSGNAQSQLTIDSVTSVVAPAGTTNGVITLMNLSKNIDLTAVLQAMRTCKNSRLLADPNVAAYDNEPALISIVTEVPYQQLTQTAQGGNIGTTSFREAGVKLTVTPRIAADGTIKLDCNPSFSRLAGYTPGTSPQPIIDRRETKTSVRVANKQTLVIGGLRTRTDIKEHSGVPFLKDLPWGMGYLFRSKSTTDKESELVVFLTPEIITPMEPPKEREAAALGTLTCKLDQIAPAESCPSCPKHVKVGRYADNCIDTKTNLDGNGDGAYEFHPDPPAAVGMQSVIPGSNWQPEYPVEQVPTPAQSSTGLKQPAGVVQKTWNPAPKTETPAWKSQSQVVQGPRVWTPQSSPTPNPPASTVASVNKPETPPAAAAVAKTSAPVQSPPWIPRDTTNVATPAGAIPNSSNSGPPTMARTGSFWEAGSPRSTLPANQLVQQRPAAEPRIAPEPPRSFFGSSASNSSDTTANRNNAMDGTIQR